MENGCLDFQPSTGQVLYAGTVNPPQGGDSILSVLGPLSNFIYGLKLFVQGVLLQKPWLRDPLVVHKAEGFALVKAAPGELLIKSMVPGKELMGDDSFMSTDQAAPALGYLEHWLATANKTGTGRPVDAIKAPVAPFMAVLHSQNSRNEEEEEEEEEPFIFFKCYFHMD
ncbi:hypothetical protein C0995_009455 [Termitomyces sp. Mi166|nr:hypothetical protein C0995_009455 [Termitomyces sp. Mi166\